MPPMLQEIMLHTTKNRENRMIMKSGFQDEPRVGHSLGDTNTEVSSGPKLYHGLSYCASLMFFSVLISTPIFHLEQQTISVTQLNIQPELFERYMLFALLESHLKRSGKLHESPDHQNDNRHSPMRRVHSNQHTHRRRECIDPQTAPKIRCPNNLMLE